MVAETGQFRLPHSELDRTVADTAAQRGSGLIATWKVTREGREGSKIIIHVHLIGDPEGGGYTAIVPGLPGVVSQGESVAEAINNVREAITGILESYRSASRDIPWCDADTHGQGSEGRIVRSIIVDIDG